MDALAGATQEECHTEFLIHLPSAVFVIILSREGFSRPFSSSTVKSNLVYPRIDRFLLLIRLFFARKNPSSCACAEIRTHVPTSSGFEVAD